MTLERQSVGGSKRDKLTPARIRILYFLWKNKGWKSSISQLAEELDDNPGNMNRYIHSLLEGGYLQESGYRLTKKGRHSISLLMLPRYLLYIILAISTFPVYWAYDEIITRQPIPPLSLLIAGATLLAMVVWLTWVYNKVERRYSQPNN